MIKNILVFVLVFARGVILAQTEFSVEPGTLLICGHRGGFYSQLPENSISAFEFTAGRYKSSRVMVEFDLRKSKDGTLFIMHDETVERTTNGRGKIDELSDTYLKTLFLKNEIGELTQEKIPTYEDVLNFAEKNKNILLMLDVKADVWREAINGLAGKGLQARSIVLTFTPEDARKVYAISKNIVMSCLATNAVKWSAVEELNIPKRNLIAYIGQSTPETLLVYIGNDGIPLMMDTSEHTTHHGELYPEVFYRELVRRKHLNILITDFPSEVSTIPFK